METQNKAKEIKGLVFDIRRFSTHDGPGLRTTVFTKGCPLRCQWCQNPEGLELVRRLCYFKNKCIGCGACINVCPANAISYLNETSPDKLKMTYVGQNRNSETMKTYISVDRKRCDLFGLCVEACPAQALVFDSKEMTVEQVVEELLKDKEFYGSSGGITLSGGDPFSQKEFTLEILKECKKNGLNTAIETCLYVDKEILELFLPYIDLLIADFKVFDAELHKLYTGTDNTIIKENLTYLFNNYFNKSNLDILVRVPLIPEYTATEANVKEIAGFLYSLSQQAKMELINYNPLAQSKYVLMNKKFLYDKNPEMYKNEEMEAFNAILAKEGIVNVIRA